MQTKKRAKPVRFGKASPPRTEKREVVKTRVAEVLAKETPESSSINHHTHDQEENPRKEQAANEDIVVSHTRFEKEIDETSLSNKEALGEEGNEEEPENQKEEKPEEEDQKQEVPENAGEEGESAKDETINHEDTSVPDEEINSEEKKASSFSQPFSREELTADEPGWKQVVLSFFLIAFVAFLLGLAFIGGVYYAGKSVKLPSINLTMFTKSANVPTKVPIPTATTTPAPTPDLSAYSVQLFNGSGITGEAAKVKTELTTAGFKVAETGNANNSDYTKTQIVAKNNVNQAYLTKLKETLQQWYIVDSPTIASSQTADVVITIGSSKK